MVQPSTQTGETFDVAVVGGGINGCGIARDAAGRGARVLLLEQGDLASGTSSASTKLIHGGLRYLEHGAFGLVRESLREREILWRNAPHLVRPMRFIIPQRRAGRPAWLLRTALFVYDHLGGRDLLPPTRSLDLRRDPAGEPLGRGLKRAWEYSDCWVDDARLVIANARDAADHGATILPRHRLVSASRQADRWQLEVARLDGSHLTFGASILVNAAGPAVLQMQALAGATTDQPIRLVRGAHIVVPRLFDHDRAYVLQQGDGRIVFAIPFLGAFTLIGTTDRDHREGLGRVVASPDEIEYLITAANAWFRQRIEPADVIWSYAGVRPLVDDGRGKPEGANRGFRIDYDRPTNGAPLLTVFGGKITSYRLLAEKAVDRLGVELRLKRPARWTANAPLPGGDFLVDGRGAVVAELKQRYDFLSDDEANRLVSAYGTCAFEWLGTARCKDDLGPRFGGGLTGAEVDFAMDREWALTADDMLWRRSKLGLAIDDAGQVALDRYMSERSGA